MLITIKYIRRILFLFLILSNIIDMARLNAFPVVFLNVYNSSEFDTYVLSMSYIPYFCSFSSHKNKQECKLLNDSWIIHGLWPSFSSSYKIKHGLITDWPEYCVPYNGCYSKYNISKSCTQIPFNECKDIMGQVWCAELGIHEWIRHGSCTGLTHLAFYQQMQKYKFEPFLKNISNHLVHITLLNKTIRNNGFYTCDDACDVQEYRECFQKNDNNSIGNPIECEHDSSSCSSKCEWIWVD